ncbi:hypothetical protein ONZ51_g50 [Trametes cubensis]|uniref:DUF6533 domain-containing protein n=1 Tax=Trametes cubensis TaxID=1111947 RepID=A0AAD7XH46_9APHY|nr:hypothetical protein ONZ51_g50 [Trametes cubensis]
MSTASEYSALVSALAFQATINYCDISIVALLIYYNLTTLNEEFKHYFKRKVTLATMLYITNRYVPLAYAFYNALVLTYSTNLVFSRGGIGERVGILAVFSMGDFLRVTHICPSKKGILGDIDPGPVALVRDCKPAPVLARVPMIVADLALVVITWKTQYKTYNLGRELSTPSRLATVLLRDGTVYFVALTILNTVLLIFEYLEVLGIGTDNHNSALVSFIEPLTAILISEFLANLHNAADRTSGTETLTTAQSTLEFRIVGSIGASLHGGTFGIAPNDTDCDDICENAQNDGIARSAVEEEDLPRDQAVP